jgi:hypothetical protein
MDNKIVTYNIQIKLDNKFQIVEETALEVPITDTQYLGCEDVRLLEGNKTLYAGMIQDPVSKSLVMGHGVYGVDYTSCKSPTGRSCEKNWALFRSGEEIRFIYEWSPLTVLDLSGTIVSKNANVPSWFRHVRGSSCGVRWKHELWFLTHIVSHVHNAPRIYYHMIVVLDATTLEYIRNSYLFQFDGEKTVEYALGLIVNADSVIISYSKFDQEALVGVYPYGEFCFTIGL